MQITNPQLAYAGDEETIRLGVEAAIREGRISEARDKLDFWDNQSQDELER